MKCPRCGSEVDERMKYRDGGHWFVDCTICGHSEKVKPKPKCMEKRILDDVPVVNICPKCGSEMRWHETSLSEAQTTGEWLGWWYCKCGHEEKVATGDAGARTHATRTRVRGVKR